MPLKRILLIILFTGPLVSSQNYVDLMRIGYGQTFNNDFEGTSDGTHINTFEADLTFPVIISEKQVFITGGSFSKNRLQLYPNAPFKNLFSTTLKLGLASTYSIRWSTTLVVLPKIASDYDNVTTKDLYVGGFALLKYQKTENLIYRFGAYGSQEAFGFFATPIVGWYYLSSDQKFEMDMSLPISADINYALGTITLGMDYFGIGRSFNTTDNDATKVYVDLSSLEFAGYIQFNTFEKSILIRAKVGYSSNNFELYNQGDKIDLGLSAFSFGDNRTQLNPHMQGGAFLKFEAVYRFQLLPGKEKKENID